MLDIAIEDDRWQDVGLEALAERAATTTLRHQGLDPDDCEISLLACGDERISVLNAEFRNKPSPTNVLSWPAQDLAPDEEGADPAQPEPDFMGELALGDIAISFDTCAREAETAGKPMAEHVTHLMVHGVLHLLGYDHIRDADATVMEALEVDILGKMGIDNPYIE